MKAPARCRPLVLGAMALAVGGCGSWVSVPGGGQQTVRVNSVPAGAALVLELETEKRELGSAPADALMSHGIERFQANPHCWWWPGVSALVAGTGAVLLGTTGLGRCVDATGATTGISEAGCEDDWQPGKLNAVGAGSVVGIAAGGLSMTLGFISCGLGQARDGAERPVATTGTVRASLPGYKSASIDVVVPTLRKQLVIELQQGEDEPGLATGGPEGRSPGAGLGETKAGYVVGAEQPSSYAIILGVETYRKVPSAQGARRDARRVRTMFGTTLGVADRRMRFAVDQGATRADIQKALGWLRLNVAKAGRVYFYFAGYGLTNPTTGASYLLPFDGDPARPDATAISLTWLLDELARTPATEVLAIIDAGFAGPGGRAIAVPGAPAVTRIFVPPVEPVVALLTASSGTELAESLSGGDGGLLTGALLEAIGRGTADSSRDARLSLREISDTVSALVGREAKARGRSQRPDLHLGRNVDPAVFVVAHDLGR